MGVLLALRISGGLREAAAYPLQGEWGTPSIPQMTRQDLPSPSLVLCLMPIRYHPQMIPQASLPGHKNPTLKVCLPHPTPHLIPVPTHHQGAADTLPGPRRSPG